MWPQIGTSVARACQERAPPLNRTTAKPIAIRESSGLGQRAGMSPDGGADSAASPGPLRNVYFGSMARTATFLGSWERSFAAAMPFRLAKTFHG